MHRKLAAIIAADIVGYSSLMGSDEMGTLTALRKLRAEVFGPTVAGQKGKVVKSMGDGWLVAFESAVDAVSCALQIQDRLADHEMIKLRVGVHVGDIVHEDEDIFGDAVNVAARLQEVAEPGGVAISEATYSSLDGTLAPSFDDTGPRELKNIERPIHIWMRAQDHNLDMGSKDADMAHGQDMGFPNLVINPISTSDERAEVRDLSHALTNDLLTYLSSAEWLLAATTRHTEIQGYDLRAALRAHQDRLRLEARLFNAGGEEIWTEKYDGDLADSFEWQDSVGESIASSALGMIRDVERQRLETRQVEGMSAEECLLCGLLNWNLADPNTIKGALTSFKLAIDKDPDLSLAYTFALSFLFAAYGTGYKDGVEEFLPYYDSWLETVSSFQSVSAAEGICIAVVQYHRNHNDTALRVKIRQVLRRSPFSAHVLAWAGWGWVWLGEPEQALDCFRKFERLGRFSPYSEATTGGVAMAHVLAGRYEAAVNYAEKILEIVGGYPSLLRALAAAYAHLGRKEEACVAIAQLLRIVPDETISAHRKRTRYADTLGVNRYFEGLRLAGLRE